MIKQPIMHRKLKTKTPLRSKIPGKKYYPQYNLNSSHPKTPSATPAKEKLKIIVLGGLEEVGRNMTVLEYGSDIIIIDMGLQFPEEDMPGIDYIIPNISYLKGKEKHIKGVFITHGHYDHIGAISHIMPEIGNPPMFMGHLTAGIVRKRHSEYRHLAELNITTVDDTDSIKAGQFTVEFLSLNHSIPDTFGIIIHTPIGTVFHTGDFKFDFNPVDGKPADLSGLAKMGDKGILALLSDSTSSEHSGHQVSESIVGEELYKIFATAPGRIIIGTFASQLTRIQQIISLAEKLGKKILLEGRSIQSNIEIAHQLGYIKIKPGTLIDENQINKCPPHKLIIIGTGAQGEKNAILMRVANNEHKYLSIEKGDTIIFSSSVIPGNERTIQTLKDTIYRAGGKVIHYQMMDIHAGGHAKKEDQKLLIRLVKPKYFIPIEANHYMLKIHAETAASVGVLPANIFVADNGQIIEFEQIKKDGALETVGSLTPKKVLSDYVMVDGLGVGDVSNIVLRDRRMMSEDGMFVVIATVDSKTGALIGSPDIISRGFVYMKESKELIENARRKVKQICKDKNPDAPADPNYIKNKIRDDIGQFLFNKTKRRPMVLPVVIEI